MELALGTEPTRTYLAFELAQGARKLVNDVMLTKAGEDVVITADTSSDWRVVEATAQAAFAAGARPTVVWYESRPDAVMEPPAPVAGAIREADVWIEYAVAYLLHTKAYKQALAQGCRYICLTGMDVDMMVRTVAQVDYPKMIDLSHVLGRLILGADQIRVTSPGGTDLVATMGGRPMRYSGKLADTPGEPIMLGGQISWCPLEETIEGTVVFDGAIWPPKELGLLRSPVSLTLEKGRVTEIKGGHEAKTFERWFASIGNPNIYRLAHYSLGFNPGVTRCTGRIVEDERVFGCIEFGIGSQGQQITGSGWDAGGHTDGIVLNPSIYLDGQAIEEEGHYVHPDLVAACQSLGVPGY
ncbi:MAG: aminopeptidase [Anaerolineae bacterium]